MKKKLSVRLRLVDELRILGLPPPDHKYGYSSKYLEKCLGEKECKKLFKAMGVNTCVFDKKLGIINYTQDIIRFLRLVRYGTPTYFD